MLYQEEKENSNSGLLVLWIELCTPKTHILKFWLPVHQNVTLFGNGVIGDIISEVEMRA